MTGNEKKQRDGLDESLRRLGGLLSSPSLVMSYEHTTPLLERAWLRRAGLTKAEAAAFLEEMCRRGLLDRGARALTEDVCRARRILPREAVRLLLSGEGWPDEGTKDDDAEAETI